MKKPISISSALSLIAHGSCTYENVVHTISSIKIMPNDAWNSTKIWKLLQRLLQDFCGEENKRTSSLWWWEEHGLHVYFQLSSFTKMVVMIQTFVQANS
jgi:hypothetical protein